ncbi:hypothetical protein MUK42_16908 [Musa troglodytarum]|uniref:Uncharacterized protein n=1 Tax=Musa troglodytarum TaxID=320322 RepID=A0A9E7HQ26_9LILI|nr:hypothetical protein MUK42_16908 [Musa troglodytarum]
MDSSVSHHITSDLQNLSIHNNYGGNEDIIIGDVYSDGGSEYQALTSYLSACAILLTHGTAYNVCAVGHDQRGSRRYVVP